MEKWNNGKVERRMIGWLDDWLIGQLVSLDRNIELN